MNGKYKFFVPALTALVSVAIAAMFLAQPAAAIPCYPASASSGPGYALVFYNDASGSRALAQQAVCAHGGAVIYDYESFFYAQAAEATVLALRERGLLVQAMDGAGQVQFESVKFNPAIGEPAIPAAYKRPTRLVSSGFCADGGAEDYFVIQLKGPPVPAWFSALENAGVTLLDPAGTFAYVARMGPGAQTAALSLPFVNWLGDYQPYYRLRGHIEERAGTQFFRITVFDGESAQGIASQVAALGGTVASITDGGHWGSTLAVIADASVVPQVSAIRGVWYVEPMYVFQVLDDPVDGPAASYEGGDDRQIMNDQACWVIQSGVSGQTPIWDQGIHGENMVAGIADTGLDYDHDVYTNAAGSQGTPGAAHRKVVRYWAFYDSWDDTGGHGTHTAGSVMGNNINNPGSYSQYDGMAYMAKISVADIGNANYGIQGPADTGLLFKDATNWSAKIHSNSWGGGTGYIAECQYIDQYAWDNWELLPFFAAGNSGPGTGTVISPGNSKNVVTVGSCENGASLNNIASTSSRGPTGEGLLKPDIIAPGKSITSAQSDGAPNTYNSAFIAHSGTSMAAPVAAGGGVLVEQYFEDGFYPSGAKNAPDSMVPSASLKKAVVINSGTEMTSVGDNIPSNNQGWGRMTLDKALYFAGDAGKLWVYDGYQPSAGAGLTTGQKWAQVINVTSGQELKIALVWADYPGSGLKNNLNLQVTAPNSDLYIGSNYLNGESVAGAGSPDSKNPVECVYIKSPQDGQYKIEVTGALVAMGGSQKFAVAVNGNIEVPAPLPVPLTISLTAPTGGGSVSGGSSMNIQWSAAGGKAPISVGIEYSLDGGSTYSSVVAGQAASGTYAWAVPLVNSTAARVKVTATDAASASATNESGDFTIATGGGSGPSATVNSPNGGELLRGGSALDITWTTTGGSGLTIDIDYSTDSGGTYNSIASGVGDTGTYSWSVPAVDTAAARVKVTATDGSSNSGSDESDADFAIDSTAPAIIVSAPAAAALVKEGTTRIQWSATEANGLADNSLNLSYSTDGGTTWQDIATGQMPSVSYYDWTVTAAAQTNTAAVRVLAADAVGNYGSGASGIFTIDTTPPSITHTAAQNANTGDTIPIAATVSDNNAVGTATVFWAFGSGSFAQVALAGSGTAYSGSIPAQTAAGTVKYHIVATDMAGHSVISPSTPQSPSGDLNYTITIKSAGTTGSISGYVKDESGNAVAGALVKAQQSGLDKGNANADASGHYQISGLDPGAYDLLANASGFFDGAITGVAVTAGADASGNDFSLAPWGTEPPVKYWIMGTVSDSTTSSALSGVTVQLYSGGTALSSMTTGSNGTYWFGGLDPGTYSVKASKSGYETKSASATIADSSLPGRNIMLLKTTAPPAQTTSDGGMPIMLIGGIAVVVLVVIVLVAVMLTRRRKGGGQQGGLPPPQQGMPLPHQPYPYPPQGQGPQGYGAPPPSQGGYPPQQYPQHPPPQQPYGQYPQYPPP